MEKRNYSKLRCAFAENDCQEFKNRKLKRDTSRIAHVLRKNPSTISCILNNSGGNHRKEFHPGEMERLYWFMKNNNWTDDNDIYYYFPEYKSDVA